MPSAASLAAAGPALRREFLQPRIPLLWQSSARRCHLDPPSQPHLSASFSIERETCLSRSHLTPELALHLITPHCRLWTAPAEECPFDDPFWGFYWPGGQAVARYVLDVPSVVRGRRVLDLGCGGGAVGLAALCAGAGSVTFNDTDKVALQAVSLNMNANNLALRKHVLEFNNLIKRPNNFADEERTAQERLAAERFTTRLDAPSPPWDVVLVGDVLYDTEFATSVMTWLRELHSRGAVVVIGDPGRQAFKEIVSPTDLLCGDTFPRLVCLAQYKLQPHTVLENRGFSSSFCWTLINNS